MHEGAIEDDGHIVGVACLSRTADLGDDYDAVRKTCERAAERHRSRGLTGFFIYRKRELFGFVEGSRADVNGLMADISRDAGQHLLRVVEVGELERRVCEGWEVRMLDGPRDFEIGLEAPLRHAIKMGAAPGHEAGQRALILRVVQRITEMWDVAATEGSKCP